VDAAGRGERGEGRREREEWCAQTYAYVYRCVHCAPSLPPGSRPPAASSSSLESSSLLLTTMRRWVRRAPDDGGCSPAPPPPLRSIGEPGPTGNCPLRMLLANPVTGPPAAALPAAPPAAPPAAASAAALSRSNRSLSSTAACAGGSAEGWVRRSVRWHGPCASRAGDPPFPSRPGRSGPAPSTRRTRGESLRRTWHAGWPPAAAPARPRCRGPAPSAPAGRPYRLGVADNAHSRRLVGCRCRAFSWANRAIASRGRLGLRDDRRQRRLKCLKIKILTM